MAKKPARNKPDNPLGNPRTFRIGRRRYVAGLFWQIAENGQTVRKEAKTLATQRGFHADLYIRRVLEVTGEAQFALARTGDGVPRKAVAAAAALATEIPQDSWVGAFPLSTGYWYVRVRDGLILPGGDAFYEDEQDIRNRVNLDIADGGFERIFAPEGWSEDADQLDFEDVLATCRGPLVVDINSAKANRATIALALVLAVGGLASWQGYAYYQSLQQSEKEEERQRALLKQKLRGGEQEKKVYDPPWYDVPLPSISLYSCAEAMRELRHNVPGFELDRITCNGRSATYYWDRLDRSNIRWIERWIDRQGDHSINVNPSGDLVTVTVSAERGDARGTEPIYPSKIVRNGLISLGQATNSRIITGDVRKWNPPGGFDPEKYKRPNYSTMPVEIDVSELTDWIEILDRIPGFVVQSVTWNHDRTIYEITGEIYVQN